MNDSSAEILWTPTPDRIKKSHMAQFMESINKKYTKSLLNYRDLHNFSLESSDQFWLELAIYVGINWQVSPKENVCQRTPGKLIGTRWFPETKLNYAQNLLFPGNRQARAEFPLISLIEGIVSPLCLTHEDLLLQVARGQAYLRDQGVKKGDRVAGIVGNTHHAVIAMLAATSLGAIWSSCSPDFGSGAIIDRFAQIEPKVIFVSAGYIYNGKRFLTDNVVSSVLAAIPSITTCITINPLNIDLNYAEFSKGSAKVLDWENFIQYKEISITHSNSVYQLTFEPLEFHDPLFILYSSGTTGVPKCIVHSIGGTLLQHKKELMLHCDLQHDERLFYYTTCGWMMWNWMVSALSVGGTLLLFDGSLVSPDISVLWKAVARHKVSILGTSPKFLAQNMQEKFSPKKHNYDFSSLKTLLSTGSPLLPEHYDWVYSDVKTNIHLASISGGTDIVSCFLLGNPLSPVRRGELQGPGLGMAVEVWDDEGQKLPAGEKGELICAEPFVSMPIGFWGDNRGEKYFAAYFNKYALREVWHHGDYIQECPSGGFIIMGRSDATLNPGGVRIGTAEIYRVVENMSEFEDSLVVGIPMHGDVQVALFVKMRGDIAFNFEVEKKVRSIIRQKLSPRHVPEKIMVVSKIPYTRSGKKMELAVQKILRGEVIKNEGAMQDPTALEDYKEIFLLNATKP